MPQIMHANPIDSEALGQMRADRLNQLAPAGTGFDQRCWIECRLHVLLARSSHVAPLFLGQLLLELSRDEALVGRGTAVKVLDQRFQMVDVVRSGGQEGEMRDHPPARNA